MITTMTAATTPVTIRPERLRDIEAREALLDAAFGAARFAKNSQRLRDGRLPADGLSFVACAGTRVIGTVRLWPVLCGPHHPALLLGPMAVDAAWRGRGVGAALIGRALGEARRRGHRAVVLVGDAPYYGRFGFSSDKTGALRMPGAHEPHRLLALTFTPGALDGARGAIVPAGQPALAPVPGAAPQPRRKAA